MLNALCNHLMLYVVVVKHKVRLFYIFIMPGDSIKKNLWIVCCRNDRYDALRVCVGESLRETMSNLKLFMVSHHYAYFLSHFSAYFIWVWKMQLWIASILLLFQSILILWRYLIKNKNTVVNYAWSLIICKKYFLWIIKST